MFNIAKKKEKPTKIADNMLLGKTLISKSNKLKNIFPKILAIEKIECMQSIFLVNPLSDEPKILKIINETNARIRANIAKYIIWLIILVKNRNANIRDIIMLIAI